MVKSIGARSQIVPLLLNTCVALRKLLNVSVPQVSLKGMITILPT